MFSINEIDNNGNTVLNSNKYDGYKFSALITTVHDTGYGNENPIEFETVVNEKWEFMLLKITLRISSYKYPCGLLHIKQ